MTTYPLAAPSSPQVRDVRVRPFDPTGMTESPITLATQVQRWPVARWELTLTLPPMTYAQGQTWTSFLQALRGPIGTFTFGDPSLAVQGAIAPGDVGSVVVDGAGQTGQTLAVRGLTTSTAGVLVAGDFLQLGSGATARLYVVTQDADSDASGNATLDIWPRLRSAPGDGDAVTLTTPQGLWRLPPGYDVGWDTDRTRIVQPMTIAALEAL